MADVTQILTAIERGETEAAEELLPLVYEELRRVAASMMAKEPAGQTLQATALVHEAYLRLIGKEEVRWLGRNHFFAAAAEAMRRILVENARRKSRQKRGGGERPINLDAVEIPVERDADRLLLVDEALNGLESRQPLRARIVKLRYFSGLSHKEIAQLLRLSEKTVRRHWTYAKAWLYAEIQRQG